MYSRMGLADCTFSKGTEAEDLAEGTRKELTRVECGLRGAPFQHVTVLGLNFSDPGERVSDFTPTE